MTKLVVSWFLFAIATSLVNDNAARANATAPNTSARGQGSGGEINVQSLGAKGDGATDDTQAIQRAIDTAGSGAAIKFPAGIYIVSNLMVKNRTGLSFVGEGAKSVLKQKAGAPRIAEFRDSANITVTELAFDANGIESYGGLVFYGGRGIHIVNNLFWDSAPKPVGRFDRYSVVFGRGGTPSQNIWIVNNVINDLQLEVNHAQKVVIEGNIVRRAVATAGIGVFTVGDGATAEEYQIIRNTIADPVGAGVSIGIDPPTDRNCVFRRITIADNVVTRSNTAGHGIRIGTPDNSKRTNGNLFKEIVIKNNRLRIESSAPQPTQIIFANTSANAGIAFDGLTVSGNKIESARQGGRGYAIDLRRIHNSSVVDNVLKGVANGISLGGDLLANEVRDNSVEASEVAYALEGSLGGNKATNNQIVGKPRQGWKLSALKTSDSVEH
jgi:hypothetical protein